MNQSELSPELTKFASRLKISYSSGGHGDKWADRNYKITLDDSGEIVGWQNVHTTRKDYYAEWRKGKVSYSIGKNIYKSLSDFLTEAKRIEDSKMKIG